MTPRDFLVRGLLAGLVAGLLSFAVSYTVGEPQVDAAIAVEEAHAADHHADESAGADHHDEGGTVVSRRNQSTWGLLTGTLAVGLSLGGLVGLVSAFATGRLGRLRPGQSTAAVALVGFVASGLVPFLKYPANPPGVGGADTIGSRTVDYFVLLGISVVAAIACVVLAQRLFARIGAYRAVLAAGGAYLVGVITAVVLLPAVNEVGDFPGDILWSFRVSSLLTLATTWGAIGVVLAGLVGHRHDQVTRENARRDLAASL